MPSGLIEDQDCVRSWRDVEGDLFEMRAHGLAIATGHDDASTLSLCRTDCAEDPGRGAPLVFWRTRRGPSHGPAAREFGLLTDARLVPHPLRQINQAPTDRAVRCGDRTCLDLLGKSAACAGFRIETLPGALRDINPSGPSVLNRITQSRTICSVTPAALAASLRLLPSMIKPNANNHRTWSGLPHCRDNRRKSADV